jgi:hypothetical protein
VLSPIAVSQRTDDPVGRALVPLSRTVREQWRGLTLDATAYADAQRRFGQELHRPLGESIANPNDQRLSDEVKARTLARDVDLTRGRVETEVLDDARVRRPAPPNR